MPVAIADGALGLEAKHVWTPPQGRIDGGLASLTLNDRSVLGTSNACFILKSIQGLHSLPDIEDERDPGTGRIGEVVYQALARGKTVVYSGTIHAPTLQKLRAASNVLRQAFGMMSREGAPVNGGQPGEGRMDITPHSSYGSVIHFFTARCLSLELGDEQAAGPSSAPTPYKRPFVLTLRLADPRVYEAGAMAESTGNASGAGPFLVNQGSAPTDPLFSVGPGVLDVVTLVRDVDLFLRFELHWTASDTLWVDFRQRYAWRDSDDVDMTGTLSVTLSNWWDPGISGFDPGINLIGATGGTWSVFWRHASW